MAAFRFGFDLPNDDAETAPSRSDNAALLSPNEESSAPSPLADTSGNATATKPTLSIVDVPSSMRSRVAEGDIESDVVTLLPYGDGAVGPLRRVVLPAGAAPPCSFTATGSADRATEVTDGALADTDLIPGVYEGGLKVWECSLDLCRHLASEIGRLLSEEEENDDRNATAAVAENDCRTALSRDGKILELGCGHGLPGCLVLRELQRRWGIIPHDGYSVLFSDYNEFVCRDATVPNILLNAHCQEGAIAGPEPSCSAMQSCVCVAGDWMDLSERLQRGTLAPREGADDANESMTVSEHLLRLPLDGRFDLILAAETTYTAASAKDTALLLGRHLKVESGIGLISTKRYYFGVGGGADAFRAAATSQEVLKVTDGDRTMELNCRLSVETIQEYDNGAGNIRDLLRVRLLRV